VIERRRAQRSFGDGLIANEVKDLREGWMNHADRLLDDEAIVTAVYEALGRRHPKSRRRGRLGAPADVVLRLLVLKHVRNWSYEVLEREVRAPDVGVDGELPRRAHAAVQFARRSRPLTRFRPTAISATVLARWATGRC